ncbi:MAG: hypothetical protein ACLQT6_16970 [Desulfomonilaceae bacterium]
MCSRCAILLFGKNRRSIFPDAVIRCARFQGTGTERLLDQGEINEHLPKMGETAIFFIELHTRPSEEIGGVCRTCLREYSVRSLMEATICI